MMRKFCTQEDSCLHFFQGMGFRPAVHVIQRDQYGDRPVLIVGDDSPLEGKVPPGWMMTDLPVDPYAPLGGAPGLTPATMASSGYPAPGVPVWGGSSGGPGGSGGPNRPDIPGNPGQPENPGDPGGTTPGKPDPVFPPIWGDSSQTPSAGDTSTQPPQMPDLPPLQPVPGPAAGILLVSALVVLTVVRSVKRGVRG